MHRDTRVKSNEITLAIHSTDNSFGFALREGRNNIKDRFFIKKFDKDLCNNLIVDLTEFIHKNQLNKVQKISVSLGPSNFNASRLIVVLARTISQQLNCQLDSYSSFKLMAKRIAIKNSLYLHKQTLWIFKSLKRKGFIAGKYEVENVDKTNKDISINEIISPKLFEKFDPLENHFQAEYNDLEDLKELLNLSNKEKKSSSINSWEKVIPLYPLAAIN